MRFNPPDIVLSERRKKAEPRDLAKPWKRYLKTLSELLCLLGADPPPEADPQVRSWFFALKNMMLVYQGEVLLELALLEKKRSASNVPDERAKAIIKAEWPNWDRITTRLWEVQEKAATAAALSRTLTLTDKETAPGTPNAGGGKKV
jgi:hypothetical protein